MPNSNFITISHKIEKEQEKKRLLEIAEKILPPKSGVIIRTSANGTSEEMIKKDLELLIKKWEDIEKSSRKIITSKSIKMVYDNTALIRRTLIDIIDQGLNRILVNDNAIYNIVNEIIQEMDVDGLKIELKLGEDLLEMYDLKKQIEKMENRKIWLKCGGFITIDKTEALTAIDVNTGKFVGTKNLEQTVLKVNKEATLEIVKQLRLRDIGGIIIVDYIDMQDEENKNKIVELLEQGIKKDRTKCKIIGFTKLNLLEMTRKNMCNNDDF